MALKTCRVGAYTRRYRKRNALTRRLVAGSAVCLTRVCRVVEHRIEASQRRKPLYVCGGVANCAYRARVAFGELLNVARSARNVPGQFGLRAVVASHMANKARQAFVLNRVVPKPREIL